MAVRQVTDPTLVARLDAQEVVDPELLEQLSGEDETAAGPHSLYSQAKLGASEGLKAAAQTALDVANIPAEMADVFASAGSWAGKKLGLGNGTYTPAPRVTLQDLGISPLQTEGGKVLSQIGDYLIPVGGEEKAATGLGKLAERLAAKPQNIAQKAAKLQGQIAKESVLGSAIQTTGNQNVDEAADEFLENMALNQIGGNVLHGGLKVLGATGRGLNSLASAPEDMVANKDMLTNPDISGFIDTLRNLQNEGIELSPNLQKADIITDEGVIPFKRVMKPQMGAGQFERLAKASNRTTSFGQDAAEDIERESNRLAQIERVGNRYLNDIESRMGGNLGELSLFRKTLTDTLGLGGVKDKGELPADMKQLGLVEDLYKRLHTEATKGIDRTAGSAKKQQLTKLANQFEQEYNRLPPEMQANIPMQGDVRQDVKELVNTYQVLHAEHPNFQRATQKATEGEAAGGVPMPAGGVVSNLVKGVNYFNPLNRLVTKPAARRAVEETGTDVKRLANLSDALKRRAAEEAAAGEEVPVEETQLPEQIEEAVEDRVKAQQIARAPRPAPEAPVEEAPRETLKPLRGQSAIEKARALAEQKVSEGKLRDVENVRKTISNPELAAQITPENYQDKAFVQRLQNLSGKRAREDVIAAMRNAEREKGIRNEERGRANVSELDRWAEENNIPENVMSQARKETFGNAPITSVSRVQTKARQLLKAEQKAAQEAAKPALEDQYKAAQRFASEFAPNTQENAQKLIEQRFASRRATGGEALPNKELENLYNSIHAGENAHLRNISAEQATQENARYQNWLERRANEEKAARERAEGQTKAQQEAANRLASQKMLGAQVGQIEQAMNRVLGNTAGGKEFIGDYLDRYFKDLNKPMSDTRRVDELRRAEQAAERFKAEGAPEEAMELPESVKTLTPDEVKELTTNLHSVLREEMDRGVSGETEPLLNAIESMAGRLEGEDARKLRSYVKSYKSALNHKEMYPNNPEVWLTNADKNGLQGDVNSYAGKLWRELVSQVTGTSKTEAFSPLSREERDIQAKRLDRLNRQDLTNEERKSMLKKINDTQQEVFGNATAFGKEVRREAKALEGKLESEMSKLRKRLKAKKMSK